MNASLSPKGAKRLTTLRHYIPRAARERDASAVVNGLLSAAIANTTVGTVITDPHRPDSPIIFANPAFYAITGYAPEEVLGRNCRFLQGPDTDRAVVQELRDSLAARRPFSGVLRNYRKDGTPFWNELYINPIWDAAGRLTHFVGIQNDVTEREEAKAALREAKRALEEANRVLEERVRERTEELAQSQIEILSRLARAAEFRDDDTGQHTQRVGHIASLLAEALGLSAEHAALIRQAAPLHDVGKIAISDLVLLKPGKLTVEEYATIKTHAATGAALLAGGRSEVVQMAERIAGSHHERWDGNGYPQGLKGENIPLEGRIVAVADVFDALTHERPYKKAWPIAEAVEEIARHSGTQFDPRVIEAFLTLPHATLV